MYATAHRVSRNGQTGVNAFLYLHGRDFPWPENASSLPDTKPGTPTDRQSISVPPGSNPVHSYLDVVAPDGTPRAILLEALKLFRQDVSERSNPALFVFGEVTLRFGVRIGLESERDSELDRLLVSLEQVLPPV
ncbi:MAG TPA: hypothetical protein VFZ09_40270 [Archangium sp.]|uniref:hypothetical protein n=1 Tax=Archangium sp. TaxID=1872627 RepID=UPI002E33F5AA|nr:hypothetical protein [Archangium sp.]HEX5752511.1 hypothetical protein [Archangium sp.]